MSAQNLAICLSGTGALRLPENTLANTAILPAIPAGSITQIFALDGLTVAGRRPVGRWHRDADGRLACVWELDIGPVR